MKKLLWLVICLLMVCASASAETYDVSDHASLDEAMSKLKNGDTIRLVNSLPDDSDSGHSMTLQKGTAIIDLNGHMLENVTMDGSFEVHNGTLRNATLGVRNGKSSLVIASDVLVDGSPQSVLPALSVVHLGSGKITLVNHGHIRSSIAVMVSSSGGSLRFENEGVVETTQDGLAAIYFASSGKQDACTIINNGDIRAEQGCGLFLDLAEKAHAFDLSGSGTLTAANAIHLAGRGKVTIDHQLFARRHEQPRVGEINNGRLLSADDFVGTFRLDGTLYADTAIWQQDLTSAQAKWTFNAALDENSPCRLLDIRIVAQKGYKTFDGPAAEKLLKKPLETAKFTGFIENGGQVRILAASPQMDGGEKPLPKLSLLHNGILPDVQLVGLLTAQGYAWSDRLPDDLPWNHFNWSAQQVQENFQLLANNAKAGQTIVIDCDLPKMARDGNRAEHVLIYRAKSSSKLVLEGVGCVVESLDANQAKNLELRNLTVREMRCYDIKLVCQNTQIGSMEVSGKTTIRLDESCTVERVYLSDGTTLVNDGRIQTVATTREGATIKGNGFIESFYVHPLGEKQAVSLTGDVAMLRIFLSDKGGSVTCKGNLGPEFDLHASPGDKAKLILSGTARGIVSLTVHLPEGEPLPDASDEKAVLKLVKPCVNLLNLQKLRDESGNKISHIRIHVEAILPDGYPSITFAGALNKEGKLASISQDLSVLEPVSQATPTPTQTPAPTQEPPAQKEAPVEEAPEEEVLLIPQRLPLEETDSYYDENGDLNHTMETKRVYGETGLLAKEVQTMRDPDGSVTEISTQTLHYENGLLMRTENQSQRPNGVCTSYGEWFYTYDEQGRMLTESGYFDLYGGELGDICYPYSEFHATFDPESGQMTYRHWKGNHYGSPDEVVGWETTETICGEDGSQTEINTHYDADGNVLSREENAL